jgi:hypothetical protein
MSGKVKNNNTIVFIVRDFSVGGINTVTSQVINSILKKGKYNIVLISLSKKNKQISYFDHLDNVHYLTDIVDGYVGIIARLINRFFPFLGSKIFSKYFNKILSEKIESLDSVYKVFLCGFGVYSNFSKVDDNRVFYISHNIKSMLLKNRSSFFYSLNINRLKEIVPEDRLITVSKAIKLDWVNNIFNGDNKDSKIRVVYNPIDSEYITAK